MTEDVPVGGVAWAMAKPGLRLEVVVFAAPTDRLVIRSVTDEEWVAGYWQGCAEGVRRSVEGATQQAATLTGVLESHGLSLVRDPVVFAPGQPPKPLLASGIARAYEEALAMEAEGA